MRKGFLIAAAIVALFGAVVAGISTSQHFRIQKEGLEQASFCAISEKINCDVVNASSYAEVFGVPVAWWGLSFYVLIAGIAFLSFFKKSPATLAFAWFSVIGSVLYSIYLAYISAAVLGVVCIECLAMYAVNVLLVFFIFAALKIPFKAILKFIVDYMKAIFGRPTNLGFKPRVIVQAASFAVVFALSWVVVASIQAKYSAPEEKISLDEKVKAFYMQSFYSIEPDPNWPIWGDPNAKVTIVEYSDFQCPFCRLAAFSIKPYLQEFKKDVRLYFVNYPLDQACNSEMEHPMHQFACLAAEASLCAKAKGDFWSYHDDLFKNQKDMSEDLIYSLTEKRGWDVEEFNKCVNSPEILAQVKKDIVSGKKIYVSGTPTVFINNRKFKYFRDPKFLQEIVREEINK